LTLALAAVAFPGSGHAQTAAPIYGSTAGVVFDIITLDDPSSFTCLHDRGRATRQMWDKRIDNEYNVEAFVFDAYFADGPVIEIVVNPEFQTPQEARQEAQRYTRALGQLPPVLRQGIRQVGIHKGRPTYSAGPGKIFVYADRTTQRVAEQHLEESLLHEAVHASLDADHARSDAWRAAQASDGRFVTRYGQKHPTREDLAESTLFAFARTFHPQRLPPVDTQDVLAAIPARLSYLERILTQPVSQTEIPQPPRDCRTD
jgi:hypothetical protein